MSSVLNTLGITGEVIMMWVIVAVLGFGAWLLGRNLSERPGKLQNMAEYGIEYLDDLFSDNLGRERSRKNFRFLASLFIFIIVSNYSGMIPGVGLTDYAKAPTSSLSVTAGLGIATAVYLQYASIRDKGLKGYLKRFATPAAFMVPLLLLDEVIKPVSLALRLYGNIFGEESVTENLYEILPIGAPIIMMALSILFCALQAIVFTTLTSIYLDEATE